MIVTPAPKREVEPVLDPVTSTRIGTRPERIEQWIHRGWVSAREAYAKPIAEALVMSAATNHELLMEADYHHLGNLQGPRPKIFGMDIIVDPDIPEWEIRTKTLDDWAKERARQLREEIDNNTFRRL